jgi:hypothetical protein
MQHPYPTDDEKQRIQAQTGWTIVKVSTVQGGDSLEAMDSNKQC